MNMMVNHWFRGTLLSETQMDHPRGNMNPEYKNDVTANSQRFWLDSVELSSFTLS